MRIVALDDYGGAFEASAACARLRAEGHEVVSHREGLRDEALVAAVGEAEAVVLTQQRTPFPRSVVEGLPKLRWLLNTGRNVGHVDAETCRQRGVEIIAAGSGSPGPAAELTWALILAAARNIVDNSASMRLGQWISSPGTNLAGKTLGIYGLGSIGSIVAQVGAAFGMKVLCYGRPGGATAVAAEAKGYALADSREAFFQEADILSIHVKSTPETAGCITAGDLALMKPSSIFVNTSRAALLEPGSLVAALRAGRPGYAALDVFDVEPLPRENELFDLTNVLLTPHLGYVTIENMAEYYDVILEAWQAKLQQG